MSKHTPGPYNAMKWGDGSLTVEAPQCTTIARMNDLGEETEANARLIAAAPDLLHQLKLAQRMLLQTDWRHEDEPMGEIAQTIAKAIAKAEIRT